MSLPHNNAEKKEEWANILKILLLSSTVLSYTIVLHTYACRLYNILFLTIETHVPSCGESHIESHSVH